MRNIIANIFVVLGLAVVAAGAWLIHPSVGLIVIGSAATIIGIGIVRNEP